MLKAYPSKNVFLSCAVLEKLSLLHYCQRITLPQWEHLSEDSSRKDHWKAVRGALFNCTNSMQLHGSRVQC